MTEDNKALARRFYEEIFNKGNLNVVEEIVATDFKLHDPNIDYEEPPRDDARSAE